MERSHNTYIHTYLLFTLYDFVFSLSHFQHIQIISENMLGVSVTKRTCNSTKTVYCCIYYCIVYYCKSSSLLFSLSCRVVVTRKKVGSQLLKESTHTVCKECQSNSTYCRHELPKLVKKREMRSLPGLSTLTWLPSYTTRIPYHTSYSYKQYILLAAISHLSALSTFYIFSLSFALFWALNDVCSSKVRRQNSSLVFALLCCL